MDRTVGTFPVVSSDCVNCEKRPCGEVAGDKREVASDGIKGPSE